MASSSPSEGERNNCWIDCQAGIGFSENYEKSQIFHFQNGQCSWPVLIVGKGLYALRVNKNSISSFTLLSLTRQQHSVSDYFRKDVHLYLRIIKRQI